MRCPSQSPARPGNWCTLSATRQRDVVQKLAAEKGLQTVAAQAFLLDPKDRESVDGLLEKLPSFLQEGLLKVCVPVLRLVQFI